MQKLYVYRNIDHIQMNRRSKYTIHYRKTIYKLIPFASTYFPVSFLFLYICRLNNKI